MGSVLTQQRDTEVGDAARWPRVRLGDVCEFIGGGTPDKSHSEYYGDEIPWVTVRDMTSSVITKTERCITRLGLERSAANLIPAGNVIISTHVGLGKVCLLAVDAAINQDLKAVIPISDRLSIEFLKTCFMVLADYIVSQGTGSTVKGVKLSFVQDLLIPLPPLPVQREIVARLERELGAVDKLAKKFEELEAAAEAEFKAELKETFEEISRRGTEVRRLGDVCTRLSSGKNITARNVAKCGTYPVYGANGLRGYAEVSNFDGECVVIGRQGALCGNVRYFSGSAYMSDHAVVAQFVDAVDARYMLYQLDNMKLGRLSAQAAQPGLAVSVIAVQEVLVVPLSVQREVVTRLDAAKAKKEKLVAAARRGRETAALMRKAILKEAFE